jgi:hypothetical protein
MCWRLQYTRRSSRSTDSQGRPDGQTGLTGGSPRGKDNNSKGYVVHGMFHLGGSSDSIDPRLDQCRRLCCDMASTASTANFIHPLKEASRLNLSPIRGPPTDLPPRARTRPPKKAGLLGVATDQPTHHPQLDYLSYLSPTTPCLRLANPTRPYPHPLPNPTLALSAPTPIRTSSTIQQHIRVPTSPTYICLASPTKHYTAPAWYTVRTLA